MTKVTSTHDQKSIISAREAFRNSIYAQIWSSQKQANHKFYYDVSPFKRGLQRGKIVVNTEIKQNVNKIKYDMNIGKSC